MSVGATRPAKWSGGIGQAFADRNFRIYSVGSVVSWITYFIQEIAFSWAAWEVTHSTAWLAAVASLTTGATIVLVPFGGVLADRYDRFRLANTAYAFDAVKAFVLAALAYAHLLSLPVICISALLHGVIHSFSIPASYGLMPRFVARSRLASAIGVSAAYTQFAIFAGPAIAGWILIHGGVAAAFATNAVGYVVFFATVALLRTPEDYVQPRSPRRSLAQDITDGAAYVYGHQGLRYLLVLGLAGDALTASLYKMMPAYSGLVFSGGAGLVALFYGAAGLGATLSALWIAHGGAQRATPMRVIWAGLGVAISVLLFAAAPTAVAAAPAMLLFGFAAEMRRTGAVSILQASVDDARRGRVMSALFLLTQVAGGIGTLAVGLSARETGLRWPIVAGAATLLMVWFYIFNQRGNIAVAFTAHASRRED